VEQGSLEPGSPEYFRWFYLGGDRGEDATTARWHEDMVLNQSPQIFDTSGTFHGYEGLRQMFGELRDSYDLVRWEPEEVVDLGDDRYLVRLKTTMRGRTTQIEMVTELGHLVAMRGDRVAQMDVYASWEEARQAAGLG